MLTLYYETACPFSLRVRIVLAEKLLPFSRRVVGAADRPSELIDFSGGEVPVLLDGSFAVCDSGVIAEYVDEAFPKPALRPFDARGRAAIRMAMRRVDADIMRPITEWENAAPAQRDAKVMDRVLEGFSVWEHKVGGSGLLFGMEFSLADVWLVAAVEKAQGLGAVLPSTWTRTHLWLSRMRERVSVRSERLVAES